ncbi:MAG: anti-sigma factor [Candidatus Binatia bacterium]
MATCPHAERLTSLLHDGELDSPLRREMITHLSSCVTCARIISFLEREQELLSQAIEVQVDSIDFSHFWQGIAEKLTEPQLSWGMRLRLWYESSRLMWLSPTSAWAVAMLFLLFVPAHVPPPASSPQIVSQNVPQETSQKEELPALVPPTPTMSRGDRPSEPRPFRKVTLDNQVQIDALDPSVSVAIRIDRANNSTVVWFGEGTSADLP